MYDKVRGIDVKIAQIGIIRDDRQRRDIDITGLVESIAVRGILQPIIIRKHREGDPPGFEYFLVAGERRLASAIHLGFKEIPCRFYEDLDEIESKIIELEENTRRSDLPWQQMVRAVGDLHTLFCARDENWDQHKTGQVLKINDTKISGIMRVYRDLDHEKIFNATNWTAALNILLRFDARAASNAVNDLIEKGKEIFNEAEKRAGTPEELIKEQEEKSPPPPITFTEASKKAESKILPPEDSIFCADFLTWAQDYSGPSFNFIHCDFPYGVNLFGGKLSGRDRHATTYSDDAEIYWKMIQTFCQYRNKLMSPSFHIMFWFGMRHYTRTIEVFRELAPDIVFNPVPLIWLKSDNAGIISDPKRQPRNIYESCLIGARDDRFILKPVSNAYAAPTDKQFHPSTKPEPMLLHFMQMFVEEGTRMLDPTCGSGSSLRAAERLGANTVIGVEVDQEYVDSARTALRSVRILRDITKRKPSNGE